MKAALALRFVGVVTMWSSACALAGCGDEAASGLPDAGQMADAGGTDRVGLVQIHENEIVGRFWLGGTVVRMPDAPGCVIHDGLPEALSPAGTLSVGGPIVGHPGGPEHPILVGQSSFIANQYVHLGPTFPPAGELLLEVDLSGSELFPAMPTQTLRAPAPEPVVVLSPVPEPHPTGANIITIRTTEDFAITWTVPAGQTEAHRMLIGVVSIGDRPVGSRGTSIHCSFPLSAGRGAVPLSILAYVRGRVALPTSAMAYIAAGDQKELAQDGVSYVLEVTRSAGSTVPELQEALLALFE
jgi:hypothetical protein